MIIDKVENIQIYSGLLNNLEQGLEAVKALPDNAADGKYEFEGGFFMLQSGVTKPMEEGLFEAHRQYADVQIVLEGCEEAAWADCKNLQADGEYNSQTDKAMYSGQPEMLFKATAGMCYIAFPHDAHKAVRHTAAQHTYKKVVMKLPL